MNRLLLLVSFVITPVLAQGATYYVAKTGSDGRTCTQAQSSSTPRLTITAGLVCLSGGDTLIIKAGTYTEGIEFGAIPSGISDTQRTIVKAAPGERVTMNGANAGGDGMTIYDRSFITIDGIWFDGHKTRIGSANTLGTPGAHYITFQNGGVINVFRAGYVAYAQSCITHMGITGSPHTHIVYRNLEVSGGGPDTGHGIYMAGVSDSIVENCNIHNNVSHGIHQFNSGGVNNNNRNVYRNNRIHDNGSFGILLGYGVNNVAYNNLVWGNGNDKASGGVWIAYGGVNGNKYYNNTIYNNTGDAIRIKNDANATVRNNICWQNSNNTIVDETGTATISNNLFINPFFADASGLNFALSANSPAIDKGMTVNEVPNDFNGVPRPQGDSDDIGAFEYTGTVQHTPPSNLRVEGSH